MISWEEKFEYDYLYIEDYFFIKDINIICCIIKKVLKYDGIIFDFSVINEKFEGNEVN